MGKYDRFFITEADGIIVPELHKGDTYPTLNARNGLLGSNLQVGMGIIERPFKMREEPHRHDCDSLLGFIGIDLENMFELDGEVELYIEGEKHIMTKSTLVYIPKGAMHCPLYFNRVGKPFMFLNIYTAGFVQQEPPMQPH